MQAIFPALLSGVPEEALVQARGFFKEVSVVKEGLYAAAHGAVAMHDVTEGGVLGAAWEMAEAARCRVVIDRAAIPIHPATAEIAAALGLDPLRLLSSGAMLIACVDGDALGARPERAWNSGGEDWKSRAGLWRMLCGRNTDRPAGCG